MARKIVQDDDIAGSELGDEELTDILGEDHPIHRLVDDEGSDDAGGCEPGNKGRRLPMSVRCVTLDPLAARRAPMTAHHIGGCSRLIDEDQPPCTQRDLSFTPVLPRQNDVWPQLLGGVNGFF